MKTIHLYLILSGIVLLFACDIERGPFQDLADDKVFSDELGIETASLGTYALLKENTFMRPYHFNGEYGGDNIALSGSTTDALYYMYNYQHIKDNYHSNSLWITSYKGIINSNKVIAYAKQGVSDRMDHVIGEMYYLRAFFYFTLVNIYGRPYNQSPTTNLGVPLILEPEPDANNLPPREKVAKIYTQIVSDLQKAAQLMSKYQRPEEQLRIFASKYSAWALLSRVYLYMENNQEAIKYASKVIDEGNFQLLQGDTYTKYPSFTPEDNQETIFACKSLKDEDNYAWGAVGGMYATINGVGWGEMYASLPLRNLLGKYPEDLRNKFIEPQYDNDEKGKALYWIIYVKDKNEPVGAKMFVTYDASYDEATDTWKYTKDGVSNVVQTEMSGDKKLYYIDESGVKTYVKVERKMLTRQGYPKYFVNKCSNQENQPQLWSPVISRLAEMYLNRAEANAKLGNTTKALEDINIIRERAKIPAYSEVPLGRTILEIVLEERRMELAFEAQRRYDIFRNGLTLDRKYPGTHDRGNAIMTIPANHPRVVDYIPEKQILAQPNLQQNP